MKNKRKIGCDSFLKILEGMEFRISLIFFSKICLIILFFFSKSLGAEQGKLLIKVEEVTGEVVVHNKINHTHSPLESGLVIEKPTLIQTGESAEMIFSCVGKISARLSENCVALLSPGKNGRYEIELKKGSITASLDPSRPKGSPVFAVRTFAGVTEATGTLFAVAEYKGQSYTSVKKGTIKKETLPPTQPDFSAYLKGAKPPAPKPAPGKTEKK